MRERRSLSTLRRNITVTWTCMHSDKTTETPVGASKKPINQSRTNQWHGVIFQNNINGFSSKEDLINRISIPFNHIFVSFKNVSGRKQEEVRTPTWSSNCTNNFGAKQEEQGFFPGVISPQSSITLQISKTCSILQDMNHVGLKLVICEINKSIMFCSFYKSLQKTIVMYDG